MNVSDSNVPVTPEAETTPATRYPDGVGGEAVSGEALHDFHRHGPDTTPSADGGAALVPAALLAAQGDGSERSYPLFVPDGFDPDEVRPFASLLAEATSKATSAVARWADRLVDITAAVLAERGGHAAVADVVAEAMKRFADSFEASSDGADDLASQIVAVADGLPKEGTLVAADTTTAIRLYFAALQAARSEAIDDARAKAQTLAARAEEMLLVDASHDPATATPEAVQNSLGGAASLFDPAALAGRTQAHRGSVRLDRARRDRLAKARATLLGFSGDDDVEQPVVLTTGPLPWDALPEGTTVGSTEEAFTEAARAFDEAAASRVEVLAAMRTVELELANAWDDEIHARAVETLTWEGCTTEQLLLLRPVVVIHVAGASEESRPDEVLSQFSRAIRTGRPVHVLIVDETSGLGSEFSDGRLIGHRRGEALAAVTQRQAFVVQSSVAAPGQLATALRRMAAAPRPGVAVVAAPRKDSGQVGETLLAAMLDAHATPCFVYDPGSGDTWAARFELGGNPDVDSVWAERSMPVSGTDDTLALQVTFADAAALVPELRSHFRLVAPDEWASDQAPLATTLGGSDGSLPYIWVVDETGTLGRALVSREIAFAAADRAHLWRFIQELGGVNNEHARRAADEARAQAAAEAAAALEATEARHAAELDEVRQAAATEAIERLVAGLLDMHTSGVLPVAGVAPAAPAPTPAPTPAETEPPAAEAAGSEPAATPDEDDDDAIGPAEPYIDTVLCTSCNECTNLNSLLFVYNGEKQAEIGDLAAGTYLQLVQGAEKCPARCIHPGAPSPGDETATDDVIARAAPFN